MSRSASTNQVLDRKQLNQKTTTIQQPQQRRNSYTSYMASQPTFDTGTIARDIYSALKKRKNPVTLRVVVNGIMDKRANAGKAYKNESSARRSISRVMQQLVVWNFVKTVPSKDDVATYSLNHESPVELPKANKKRSV